MLLMTIILIVLLSFALIGLIVKGRVQSRKIKTAKQFHDAIWTTCQKGQDLFW